MSETPPQKKLFFAHPRGTYNSKAEQIALDYIRLLFPHHEIINPNSTTPDARATGERRKHRDYAADVDCLVFMPFGDGKIDRMTAHQITSTLRKNGEVHELHVRDDGTPSGMCSTMTTFDRKRALNINETIMHDYKAGARAGAKWTFGR